MRKRIVGALQLLKANDVGLGGSQPAQQIGQTRIDVIDVEGGNLHLLHPLR
jgi:hypothetical protein